MFQYRKSITNDTTSVNAVLSNTKITFEKFVFAILLHLLLDESIVNIMR